MCLKYLCKYSVVVLRKILVFLMVWVLSLGLDQHLYLFLSWFQTFRTHDFILRPVKKTTTENITKFPEYLPIYFVNILAFTGYKMY